MKTFIGAHTHLCNIDESDLEVLHLLHTIAIKAGYEGFKQAANDLNAWNKSVIEFLKLILVEPQE